MATIGMDLVGMAIPDYESVMLPLLEYISNGKEYSLKSVVEALSEKFQLSDEERNEPAPGEKLSPTQKQTTLSKTHFYSKVTWAREHMEEAGLLCFPKRGFSRITERGMKVLKGTPARVDEKVLMQFPEYVEYRRRKGKRKANNVKDTIANFSADEAFQPSIEFEHQAVKLNLEYSLNEVAKETGFDERELVCWIRAVERKKQAILYGSPGTGKTFIAEKLSEHLISGGDGFKELVQFHPSYAYEEFIQGIRPQERDGELKYPLIPGRFLDFCQKAESCQNTCVLIIDEINRANITQVFGELMYLLEYRDRSIPLAGGGTLRIPTNVRIIGTMNTADRSIALIDYALRRRFAFIELRPQYEVLRRYNEKKTGYQVDGLIGTLKRLNNAIDNKHYEVGISFFLIDNLDEQILEDIWCLEIEPYLEEYFFNQLDKVNEFRWEKIKPQISL